MLLHYLIGESLLIGMLVINNGNDQFSQNLPQKALALLRNLQARYYKKESSKVEQTKTIFKKEEKLLEIWHHISIAEIILQDHRHKERRMSRSSEAKLNEIQTNMFEISHGVRFSNDKLKNPKSIMNELMSKMLDIKTALFQILNYQ